MLKSWVYPSFTSGSPADHLVTTANHGGGTVSLPKTPFAFNSGQLLATFARTARNPCGPQGFHSGREVHPLELNPFKTVRSS